MKMVPAISGSSEGDYRAYSAEHAKFHAPLVERSLIRVVGDLRFR